MSAVGDRAFGGDDGEVTGVVGSGEQHTLALDATQRCRLQIGDDDDLLANQYLRFVVGADAGDDLSVLAADIDRQHQQPIGVRMRDRCGDGSDAQLELAEIVD